MEQEEPSSNRPSPPRLRPSWEPPACRSSPPPSNGNKPVGSGAYLVQTVPSPLWTHPNSHFTFSSMAAGSSQIYIGGYVDSPNQPLQSIVYRTTIEATGTALTIPVQALPMEGGEYCTSLYGYLNYVFVGSNLGIRMCRTIAAYDPTGNEGDLEAGPLIPGLFPPGPVNSPVYAMTANNRFVYFGWNNYDSFSTGLGRCDLCTFIDTQAPAFASDLMVNLQGTITSMDWCTINNQPIFVVQGQGVYTGTDTFVESGYHDLGLPRLRDRRRQDRPGRPDHDRPAPSGHGDHVALVGLVVQRLRLRRRAERPRRPTPPSSRSTPPGATSSTSSSR